MRNAQPNSDKLILNRITKAKRSGSKSLDLSVSRNNGLRLTEIPDTVFELDQLKNLNLAGNSLTSVPDSITRLQNLTHLDLSENRLAAIPESVLAMSSLEVLSLEGNPIEVLNIHVLQLPKLRKLKLKGTIINDPPPEIQAKGLEAIKHYFHQLETRGKNYLYEAKLIFIGEGGAGKTTLAQKILNSNYQFEREPATQGIEVRRWAFEMENGELFHVNMWDFGGQEIYHATHKLFLTRRSLYILVADTRHDNTDFYYWLNLVESLSDGSPLLIVKNEKQNHHREINERQLRRQFPNIRATHATNLATNRGLNELVVQIKRDLCELPHIGTTLPTTWVNIRRALENSSRNYISIEEYSQICEQHGLTVQEDKLHLSDYFHDLGVFLHFQSDPLLSKLIILNPTWATNAFYRILENWNVIQNYGRFSQSDLARIWSDTDYLQIQTELLQLMIKFNLCYRIPSSDIYIAPQLLSRDQPDYNWDDNNNLVLRYRYEFMPKGILTQLIVTMYPLIDEQRYVWNSGVVLDRDQTKAEIIEYYSHREIRIRVSGKNKKELMTSITYELDKVNSSYSRLRYDKLVPCLCKVCREIQEPYFYGFDVLRRFKAEGVPNIRCPNSYLMVSVSHLIDQVLSIPDLIEDVTTETSERAVIVQNAVPTDPPDGISTRGVGAIGDYYRQGLIHGFEQLFEAKVLIVGEPGAGKTSLMNKLIDPKYVIPNAQEEPTLGVEVVENWSFPYVKDGSKTISANIWDFGGHQVQYLIHQYFLTSRALYILVADDRQQRTEFDYWFEIIRLLGKDSPVLVVLNEKNYQSITNFDERAYRERYSELLLERRNVDLSKDITDIREKIQTMISNLKHIGEQLPAQWIPIREALARHKRKNHIPVTDYFDICLQYGLTAEEDQLTLSRYLHDLGTILHFPDDSNLSSIVITNPPWMLNAIYEVLSDKSVEDNGGRFKKEWLFDLWSQKGYNFYECNNLLNLMKKDTFELCYELPSEGQEYIVPQFLPTGKPNYEWDGTNNLHFRIQYRFMPRGIISRLIVRLHTYIAQGTDSKDIAWAKGAVFVKEDLTKGSQVMQERLTKAEVIEDITPKEGLKIISIRVSGSPSNRREFLTIIREDIKRLHTRSFKGLSYEEKIPCICPLCKADEIPEFYSYSTLLRFKENNKPIQCKRSFKLIDVASILNNVTGVTESTVRPARNQIFISYSHKDKQWLEELQRMLKPLTRSKKITLWSDTAIKTGKKWKDEIRKAIDSAAVAVLLVSQHFLASDFIADEELPPLLEAAKTEGLIIFWVAVSHCLYEETIIKDYQAANDPSQPLTDLSPAELNKAIADISRKIKEAAEAILKSPDDSSFSGQAFNEFSN